MSSDLRFQWDPDKDRLNIKKHKVSFEEASSAFLDENGLLLEDPDHSEEEDRFVLLGVSALLRLLVVCHCYRARGGIIRIISARKADRTENRNYFKRFKP